MPLRDHFRAPVNDRHTWDELHGGWPMMIVRQLYDLLPPGYTAAPNVHLGRAFEVDVSAFEEEPGPLEDRSSGRPEGLAPSASPQPTLSLETDLTNPNEYEVRIYDAERGRRLVAAIEIVSPSNKDRPESRRAFTARLVALLQQHVCVSVIDLVTIRPFNFYADLLEWIGGTDPMLGPVPPHLYAVSVRNRRQAEKTSRLEAWFHPMALGQSLPTLPIWLDANLSILLPLEPSCQIPHG